MPPAGGWPDDGYYVGPHIFADVAPDAVIAQEEIFGPVVAVMKARDMDEALAIANGTQYALTGGLISRSPATIARVRREFLVGNLYINRGTTGALVERQAFGGFKMSGIGCKAGGPDYLAQFMGGAVAAGRGRRGRAPAAPPSRRSPRRRADRRAGEARARRRRTTSSAGPPPRADVLKGMSADGARRGHGARRAARPAERPRASGAGCSPRRRSAAPTRSGWAAQEVAEAADDLERLAALIGEVDTVRRMGHQPGELNHYFYQPRGLVLALASSRQPLTSACTMAGAALAAGDPVVLKPGSRARESSAYLARLLVLGGLPGRRRRLPAGLGR